MSTAASQFADVPLHLLRRALQRYTAVWNQEVPQLTPPQFAVLIALSEAPLSDQSTLTQASGVDSSTMTPLLDRLAQSGFVERSPDPDNRRRNVIRLTEEGHALLKRVAPAVERVARWPYDILGEDGLDTLIPLLRTLAGLDESG